MILKDFKQFITERHILEIAAAIVLGNAFTAVMVTLIHDILTPLFIVLVGHHTIGRYGLTLGETMLYFGPFIQAILNFFFVAIIFFLVIRTMRPIGIVLEKNVIDPIDEKFIDPVEHRIRRI